VREGRDETGLTMSSSLLQRRRSSGSSHFFICGKFSIKKEKKKTLVSSPVFTSRTFLTASHPFLSPQGVLPLTFSFVGFSFNKQHQTPLYSSFRVSVQIPLLPEICSKGHKPELFFLSPLVLVFLPGCLATLSKLHLCSP